MKKFEESSQELFLDLFEKSINSLCGFSIMMNKVNLIEFYVQRICDRIEYEVSKDSIGRKYCYCLNDDNFNTFTIIGYKDRDGEIVYKFDLESTKYISSKSCVLIELDDDFYIHADKMLHDIYGAIFVRDYIVDFFKLMPRILNIVIFAFVYINSIKNESSIFNLNTNICNAINIKASNVYVVEVEPVLDDDKSYSTVLNNPEEIIEKQYK